LKQQIAVTVAARLYVYCLFSEQVDAWMKTWDLYDKELWELGMRVVSSPPGPSTPRKGKLVYKYSFWLIVKPQLGISSHSVVVLSLCYEKMKLL